MADDERIDHRLQLRPHMQEGGALRRHQPFVAVAGIEIGAEGVESGGMMAGRMRAVDDAPDAALPRLGDERARSGSSSAVGEVMWLRKSTRVFVGDAGEHRLGNAAADVSGSGTSADDDARAGAAGDKGERLLERAVFVVGGQDLVARARAAATAARC